MFNLIELTDYGQKRIWINPAHIVRMMENNELSVVFLSTGSPFTVKESPLEIQKRIDQSRLINSNFLANAVEPKNIDDITQDELRILEYEFLGQGDQYANFETFWGNFLSDSPTVLEMTRLLTTLQDMGYQLEDEVNV